MRFIAQPSMSLLSTCSVMFYETQSQVVLVVKNPLAGSIPGSGRSPGEANGKPLQYSCLENPYGQKSLVGSGPWCHKESDTTEQLSTAQHSKIFMQYTPKSS